VSLAAGYLIVAFGSTGGPSAASGVPSSRQKFKELSVYVRLQVGQRFIVGGQIIGKAQMFSSSGFQCEINH